MQVLDNPLGGVTSTCHRYAIKHDRAGSYTLARYSLGYTGTKHSLFIWTALNTDRAHRGYSAGAVFMLSSENNRTNVSVLVRTEYIRATCGKVERFYDVLSESSVNCICRIYAANTVSSSVCFRALDCGMLFYMTDVIVSINIVT